MTAIYKNEKNVAFVVPICDNHF